MLPDAGRMPALPDDAAETRALPGDAGRMPALPGSDSLLNLLRAKYPEKSSHDFGLAERFTETVRAELDARYWALDAGYWMLDTGFVYSVSKEYSPDRDTFLKAGTSTYRRRSFLLRSLLLAEV